MKPAEIRRQTQQRRILAELRGGKNLSQSARAAGITDRTLRNWRRADSAFERRVLDALSGKGSPAAGAHAAPAMPSIADWALRRGGTQDVVSAPAVPDDDDADGGWSEAWDIVDRGGQGADRAHDDGDGVVPDAVAAASAARSGAAQEAAETEAGRIATEAHDNADLWREWAEYYESGGTPEQAVEAWRNAAAWRERAYEAVPWDPLAGDPYDPQEGMHGYSTLEEFHWSATGQRQLRRAAEFLAAAQAKQAGRDAEAVRQRAVVAEIQQIEREAAERIAAVRQRGMAPAGSLPG